MKFPQQPVNSTFVKNVLTLISGNAIALFIPIILYPILSRIFSPEDYALFGVYFSVFIFLEIASAGRYDFAVVMPKKDEDAINLIAGGLILSIIYSLAILFLVIFLRGWLADSLNNPLLTDWLFFLPPTLLLISISKLCNNWLIRRKEFRASSFNKASQKLAEVTSQLSFGFLKIGNGLILGDFVGRLFNALVSIYQSLRSGLDRRKVSIKKVKMVLIEYSQFPRFGILPSMLNTLGGMLPVFIISSFYSVEVSGSFNFSRIILSVPFALISAGISQVLMQQVSERRNHQEAIAGEIFSLARKLVVLSGVGSAILYLAAPQLFELFFGIKWRQSGEFTSILIFSYAISFVVSPFSILLSVLGKLKLMGYWQTFYFFVSCSLWLFSNVAIERFLLILVIVDVVSYLLYGLLIYRVIKYYDKNLMPHP
jgi:O-antigen/teichoic acid export membrane protein